ncbi:hypothetical protein AN958_09802 [Leucoagaricus sp. SymC.cos]|nr:hypothetical protein AN958_09802 [Leucoagaricus sp. SymC.cos]
MGLTNAATTLPKLRYDDPDIGVSLRLPTDALDLSDNPGPRKQALTCSSR